MTALPDPTHVQTALIAALTADSICVRDGDLLMLDTPYPLQDGHFLRVYIEAETASQFTVSDGGFAVHQAELFASSAGVLRNWLQEFHRIATTSGVEWNGEFRFTAPDLDTAIRRLSGLVIAVDRALALLQTRPQRSKLPLRERLGEELRAAGQELRLQVEPNARIVLSPENHPIQVDYRLRRDGADAAVEVLSGRSQQGVSTAVDHIIANFHELAHGGYKGLLVAVYDEDSRAAESRYRRRFEAAKPEHALLIPGSSATATLIERLAA